MGALRSLRRATRRCRKLLNCSWPEVSSKWPIKVLGSLSRAPSKRDIDMGIDIDMDVDSYGCFN